MRDDQRIRGLGAIVLVVAYVARLGFVGNGPIGVFGYMAEPFGLLVVAIVVLALPETVEMLPFGPSRND